MGPSMGPYHSRASYQTTKDTPTPESALKLFRLANPKSAYLVESITSYRNHSKGSCLCFLLLPSASWWTLVLPVGPHQAQQAASSGSVSITIHLFNESFPDLVVSTYLNNNNIHILKTHICLTTYVVAVLHIWVCVCVGVCMQSHIRTYKMYIVDMLLIKLCCLGYFGQRIVLFFYIFNACYAN